MNPSDNNIILQTKKVSEISGKFSVPAYQRGYRWGKEATRLLDDIMEIADSDYRYCLQPIVVKKLSDENSYELIDGKKRLTILFLTYKVIEKMLVRRNIFPTHFILKLTYTVLGKMLTCYTVITFHLVLKLPNNVLRK